MLVGYSNHALMEAMPDRWLTADGPAKIILWGTLTALA